MKGQSLSSDVCGPIKPPSRSNNLYFITLIDTATRYACIHLLNNRSQAPCTITNAIQYVSNQLGHYPKLLTTDNAKVYLAKYVQNYLTVRGIHFRPTTPYTPQENALAERINRTIMNSARAALAHSKLPAGYWQDAVMDAVFKYNITYHHSIQNIPYTLWHGSTPKIAQRHIFGELGSIPISKGPKTKLQLRAHPERYMYAIDDKHIKKCSISTPTNMHPYEQQTLRSRKFR